MEIIKTHYKDFGPTLAHEKLTERHGLQLSRESVRKLMIQEGFWKEKSCVKILTFSDIMQSP